MNGVLTTGQTTHPFNGLWLYEITDGRMGESFSRVYAVATCEAHALMAALASFQTVRPKTTGKQLHIVERMPIQEGAVSKPSSEGLEP